MSGAVRLAAENVRASPRRRGRRQRVARVGPSCRSRGAGAAPSPTPAAPTRPSGPCPATPSHARARRRRGRAPRPGWSRAPQLRLGGAPARDPGVGTEVGGWTAPRSRLGGRRAHSRPLPRLGQRSRASCRGRLPASSPRGRRPPSRSPLASLPGHRPSRACSPRGHVPLQPRPPALRACRLHPPPGFKLKFPDWGRQRAQRANPAPFWRKPRPTSPPPARHAPGAETPAGRPRPRGQATPTAPAGVGGGPSRGIRAASRPSAPPRRPGSASERPWR